MQEVSNRGRIGVQSLIGTLATRSPLGSPEQWPPQLTTIFATLAASPQQIVVFWGEDYVAFYNDAYAPTIGEKHPHAFGRPAREYWSELWDDLRPLLDQVRERGEPIFMKDRPFYIERHGHPEMVTFDISYSAIPDTDGLTAGVLCVVNETTERTMFERRLRESEQRFRNMADHAPVMLWVVDETGNCTYLNTRWYEYTGQTEEAAQGFGWLGATHPDDKDRVSQIFMDALENRTPFRLEYRLRRADGVYRWAIDAAEPRFTAEGQFLGYIGSVIDIDERHEMERKLLENENGLRALTNSIDQMVWSTRPDGFHDFFNDRWYEFTGVPAGSTDGAAWNGIFHPDDQDRAWAVWRHSLETGAPYQIEYRLRHRSGHYRWVIGRANPVRDGQGAILRWYGSCTDVHELKTAELQRSAILAFDAETAGLASPGEIAAAAARRIGEMLKASRVAYGTIDESGTAISVEQDWVLEGLPRLVGLTSLHSLGVSQDVLRSGQALIVETAVPPLGSSVTIPLMEQGALAAVVFVEDMATRSWSEDELSFLRDIASRLRSAVERKRAENGLLALTETLEEQVQERTEELRKSEERLRQSQRLETIGKLTGGVAHDFNNLLQVVAGNLHLLLKDVSGNERAERRVTNAMAGVSRGAKLASQLLAFGRRQALDPKTINIGRFVSNMDDMLRRSLGDAIEIETIIGGGLWNCLIDPGQVENAILNLAINARDAMEGHGKLTIEVGNAYLDDDYAARHDEVAPGQYVVVSVTDTGSGIPPELIDQVIEPFFSTKPEGKGTGLGLSMVFGFVKQSGGHVKIYSELGHGTTVKIYLPRAFAAEDREVVLPAGPIESGTETILVAEDDDEVRATVVETLLDLGYTVLKAPNAEAALVIIEAGMAIDLLFTDVVMPGSMKSTELVKKALERQPGMAVLYTSGYTENSIVHGGRLDPGVELLSKPYTRDALARKIRQVLAGRPPRPDAKDTPVQAEGHGPLHILLVEDDELIRADSAELLTDLGHVVFEAESAENAAEISGRQAIDVLITDLDLPDGDGRALAGRLRETDPRLKIIIASGADLKGDDLPPGAVLVTKPYGLRDLQQALARV